MLDMIAEGSIINEIIPTQSCKEVVIEQCGLPKPRSNPPAHSTSVWFAIVWPMVINNSSVRALGVANKVVCVRCLADGDQQQ